MQTGRDDGHAVDGSGISQDRVVRALGGFGGGYLRLPRRVSELDDVPGASFFRSLTIEVPEDEPHVAGSKSELDAGGVDHHFFSAGDSPDHSGESHRLDLPIGELDARAHQAWYYFEHLEDFASAEARHHRDEMSFSTRSSRLRNGSLHSTVRCA